MLGPAYQENLLFGMRHSSSPGLLSSMPKPFHREMSCLGSVRAKPQNRFRISSFGRNASLPPSPSGPDLRSACALGIGCGTRQTRSTLEPLNQLGAPCYPMRCNQKLDFVLTKATTIPHRQMGLKLLQRSPSRVKTTTSPKSDGRDFPTIK